MKPGTHCIATGFHGGPQQPSLEIGFENWVWAFGMPTQPCGWPPFVFCILLPLIIELFPYLHANGNFLQAIPRFYD